MRKLTLTAVVAAFAPLVAHGQAYFSEILMDLPSTDNGREFIEIGGPANFDLTGWTLLVLESEGANKGLIDQAISLNGRSTGANGLALLRDSATVLQPAPAADTNVYVADFVPDIENGSNTFVLMSMGSFVVGTDLDANNDGVIDAVPPGASDAVSFIDPDDTAPFGDYGADFGGTSLGQAGGVGAAGFTPDSLYRLVGAGGTPDGWAGGDVTTGPPDTAPGPFNFDPAEVFGFAAAGVDPSMVQLSPGNLNVPEPAGSVVVALMAACAIRRRRA